MIRFTIPALPPSVNRKTVAAKELRAAWCEVIAEHVFERLNPHGRYAFRYCVMGKFENLDGTLSRRDHMNIEKPLIDDVSRALGIDDSQFVCKEGWKVHREGEECVVVIIEEMEEREPTWL